MENFKKGYLLIDYGISLSKKDCPTTLQKREHMSTISYTSVVGSIIYTMTCTRLNVAHSLEVVSRYQSDPSENH